MKRIRSKMSISAPASTINSRSSSNVSLNSLAVDDIINNEEYKLDRNININNLQEIEQNMPIDPQYVPDFNKRFTESHPLGNLILRLTSMNKELCKKVNIKPEDNPDLEEVCKKFVEAIKFERARNVNKYSKISSEIEDKILNKELNFAAINASIQPPEYFSPTPVILTPAKMQEAMKTFPTKTSQKFSGSQNGVNILEFLHSLNTAQSIMNLSKKEFLQLLQKSVTGKVYTLVSECISYDHEISDLYHSLLTLYDTRMTSAIARKLLMNYKAQKNQTLSKVQSQIMTYASRIASQIPAGPSRTAMFNLEANNALIRCLPPASANVVTNVINGLAAKLQKSPTFVQTIKCLTKYNDTINIDIQRNGVLTNKSHHAYAYDLKPNYKVMAMNRRDKTFYNNNQRPNKFGNKRYQTSNKPNNKQSGNYKVNSIQYQTKYNDSPDTERVYNINNRQDRRFNNRNNQNKENRQNRPFKGLYCSLCGSKSHTASQICYRMRDAQNRIVETVPSFYPCEICLKKTNRKLYHPMEMCFMKDKVDKEDNKTSQD